MILDYSYARPSVVDLHGANVTGVIRYLSHDQSKSATKQEISQLHAAGIPTALVFEDAGGRPVGGAVPGKEDGIFAAEAAIDLGLPAGRPIYAACDFDLKDYAPASTDPMQKLGPVAEYLKAFSAQIGAHHYELGVYGGYWCVSRAASANLAPWTWQTVAWSGNLIFEGIRLYQPGQQVFNGNADINLAATRDYGQWRKATFNLTGIQA